MSWGLRSILLVVLLLGVLPACRWPGRGAGLVRRSGAPGSSVPTSPAQLASPADTAAPDWAGVAATVQPASATEAVPNRMPVQLAVPTPAADARTGGASSAPQAMPVPETSPEIPVPPAAPPAAAAAGTVEAVPPAPFTLEEAIGLLFDANPDLASATAQMAAADAALARARSEFYPRLGISEQYGLSNSPVTSFMFQLNQAQLDPTQDFNAPPTVDDFHTQLRLQHQVYAGQRRIHQLHAAEANSAAATMQLAAVQNQLVFRVAEAYYRLLQARNLIRLRREATRRLEEHLKIVRTRFDNGTAVPSDVLTVEVRLAEEREALITARNQFELAWCVLENVIGQPVARRTLPERLPPAPWTRHVDALELAIDAAQANRAEIGALASRRAAAEESALVARSRKGLDVGLVADYNVYTGDFVTGNDSFFVGVLFQLNLFDGGRTRWDVARAEARVRELRARERRVMLDIELDVRRAYLQLKDAEERVKVAGRAIEQAEQSLREIETRYRGEVAGVTELVDAQVALSNAQVRHATAEIEVAVARARLERAAGRLDALLAP